MPNLAEMIDETLEQVVDGCIKEVLVGGCLLLLVVFAAGIGIGLLF